MHRQNGSLSGFRVLEMGSTIAGPFCGRLLADFGAEVIKIEAPEGDAVRFMGKRFHEKSLYAASIFRNKSLIALDLRSPKGQQIVKRLIPQCDVVVENFRAGGLERWGLGYNDLAAINPGLVMVRISGYGQSGPYSERPGYGVISEAVSGLRHITGDADRPPSRVAVSLTDYITGLYGAFGAVMALLVRGKTGRGQFIDAALYECAFSFMEPHVPAYEKLGVVAMRAGSRLPDHAPNNLYATADGQFIHIVAASDTIFGRLTVLMGSPDLMEDERFASPLARARHAEEIDEIVARWTHSLPVVELERVLNAVDVPAGRIFTMADIFSDAQYRSRQMLESVPDDELGNVTLTGVVPKLSETPGSLRRTGGCIGRDTKEVLSRLAGLSESEIAELEASGVIRTRSMKKGEMVR